DLTNQRKNLPINLVLKEGVTIKDLGQKNYIVQMRLTDTAGKRIYAYAPKGTSMDYSTYTKTTSVSLEDKVNRLFIKGGYQSDGKNATVQEFVMSEFIANPEQYDDKSNLGIIRTQYTGQRSGNAPSPTTGGQPIAFTQVFDANLLNYLKPDKDGNVAYVNVFENTRLKSKWSKNVGIKLTDFNKSADEKLAYLVIGTHDFQKAGVKKVEVPQHDQHTMIQGYYITGIDYVVDKSKFEDTFAGRDDLSGGNKTRKLNYSMISGWTNPNVDGWVVYEKEYKDGYVAQEGDSYLIDTTSMPEGGQIMIQFGDDDAIIRKQQGYYSYYITSDKGIEKIEEYAKGVFKFDLREGSTIKAGDKIRVFMPYTKDHKDPVNFLEINNATKRNYGAATLTLNKDRNITVHMFKDRNKGHFVLKYTLADGTESSMEFTPKGLWSFSDKDRILTGVPNRATDGAGGNVYLNTKKLKPGADIIVESYDENGKKID
ncbi:MAG: adhesin, partial [Finegoldia magna]|nr:adhesin [Finegoldia magna]